MSSFTFSIETPAQYDFNQYYPEGHLIPYHIPPQDTIWSTYQDNGGSHVLNNDDVSFEDVCNIITSGLYDKQLENATSTATKFLLFITDFYPPYNDFNIDAIMADKDDPFYERIWATYLNFLEHLAYDHHTCRDFRKQ